MALITRLSRMFRADMHAVLDRIEEPQQLLQQAIREMEEALLHQQQELTRLQQERQSMRQRIEALEQALRESDEELDICFQSGREELARPLIRRRLEKERLARMLSQQADGLGERGKQLEARIAQNRVELAGMQQKAEVLATDPGHGGHGDTGADIPISVSEEEVEVALLRERQRRMPS